MSENPYETPVMAEVVSTKKPRLQVSWLRVVIGVVIAFLALRGLETLVGLASH